MPAPPRPKKVLMPWQGHGSGGSSEEIGPIESITWPINICGVELNTCSVLGIVLSILHALIHLILIKFCKKFCNQFFYLHFADAETVAQKN